MYNIELNEREVRSIGENRWIRQKKVKYIILCVVWFLGGLLSLVFDNAFYSLVWAFVGGLLTMDFYIGFSSAGKRFLSEVQIEQGVVACSTSK